MTQNQDQPTAQLPAYFDRRLDGFRSNQDAVKAGPSQKRIFPPFGIGSQLFAVETYRVEGRDTIFLECYSDEGQVRLVIPPEIAAIIARQYDALGGKSRSKAAKALAQERKDAGIQPGFMRRKS